MSSSDEQTTPDLRAPLLGAAAWAGALTAQVVGGWWLAAVLAGLVGVLVGVWWRARRAVALTLTGLVVAGAAVAGVTAVRELAVTDGPVAALAAEGAAVSLEGSVVSDPRPVEGRFGDQVVVRLQVRSITGRGLTHELSTPVLVIGDGDWADAELGAVVRTSGRLADADDGDLAGLLVSARSPRTGGPAGRVVARSSRGALGDPAGGRAPPLRPARPGACARGRRRRRSVVEPRGGLPDHRADPPDRCLGHQPDPRGGLPAGAGPVVPGARPVALRRRRGGHRRVRPPGSHRAERAASGGDGVGGTARPGWQRPQPRDPGAGCRGAGAAARATGARDVSGFRALGAGHGRHRAARTRVAGRAGPLATALAGRGDRGAGRCTAGLHAAGRRRSRVR